MHEICQTRFPEALLRGRPLPGIAPLGPDGWLTFDEVYAEQMAYRRHLIAAQRGAVLATCQGSDAAQLEALAQALEVLKRTQGFDVSPDQVRCPDGRVVALDAAPLEVLGALVQEDICILERKAGAAEHVLSAGLMCFPASWMLSEKIGRPLSGVHDRVDEYSDALARRVQRLFDGVKVGRPLWRFNKLWYADADLFQPRSEHARRAHVSPEQYKYLRMEKQSMVRLPRTQAVVFSIHTYVFHRRDVPMGVAADGAG